MKKSTLAFIVGAACVLLVIGGVVGAMALSSGNHLRDSYKDAGKAVIIAESPVIIAAHLDAVEYDGEYTTLTFTPGLAMKGSYDEDFIVLRFSGDHTEKAVNPTPQPEFAPGGEYYLFLQRNHTTGEISTSYGFAGMFVLGEDGIYHCCHHTARWGSFSKYTLFVDVYVMPPLRGEIAPTASPVPSPPGTERPYPTVPEITPTPTPTKKS